MMSIDRRCGRRVRVMGGMAEFVGCTGTIVCLEKHGAQRLYRVELDEAVRVPSVGLVCDDLWEGRFLKTLRS